MNDELLYQLMPALYRQRDDGQHLQRYMRVLGSQFSVLHEDIEALLDNWFIETCDDWVVPYLGDLVQAGPIRGGRHVLPGQRTLVGNTLAYRSGKGSLGVLEQAAAAISGWSVSAAEGADALALTQPLQWLRPGRPGSADLRNGRRGAPRSAEVRLPRADAGSGEQGRYNLHAVALSVCRLARYPVRNAEALALGGGRYTFHPLGCDQPLFDAPPRPPLALGMEALRDAASPALAIRVGAQAEPAEFKVADLSGWVLPAGAAVAVDPLRGRLMLGADAGAGLNVDYHYGMSADLGGGPYPRASLAPDWANALGRVRPPGVTPAWSGALCRAAQAGCDTAAGIRWFSELKEALADWAGQGGDGALRILDSGIYHWPAGVVTLAGGAVLTIEAASGVSPAVLGDLALASGDGNGTLALAGLRCQGALKAEGSPLLRLHHCTWLPGAAASISTMTAAARIEMDHCITGRIRMGGGTLAMRACIVDGGTGTAIDGGAALRLAMQYCTVLGDATGGVVRVADSLVTGTVFTLQPELSHMRFSHAAPGPDAPRRYRCYPDHTPGFTSLRYGQPGYCQLGAGSHALRQGAEDGGEVGVFHALYQHQREAALRDVVAEYLPMSLHAGIYFLN